MLLYSRSFSSFFVRRDKILPFNYQAVTEYLKISVKMFAGYNTLYYICITIKTKYNDKSQTNSLLSSRRKR